MHVTDRLDVSQLPRLRHRQLLHELHVESRQPRAAARGETHRHWLSPAAQARLAVGYVLPERRESPTLGRLLERSECHGAEAELLGTKVLRLSPVKLGHLLHVLRRLEPRLANALDGQVEGRELVDDGGKVLLGQVRQLTHSLGFHLGGCGLAAEQCRLSEERALAEVAHWDELCERTHAERHLSALDEVELVGLAMYRQVLGLEIATEFTAQHLLVPFRPGKR
jgi:hypothetical protein